MNKSFGELGLGVLIDEGYRETESMSETDLLFFLSFYECELRYINRILAPRERWETIQLRIVISPLPVGSLSDA